MSWKPCTPTLREPTLREIESQVVATESVHSLVIGAGISGLAAALTLKSRGHQVLVLEHRERAGGWIRTEAVQGYRLEWGPHSLPYSAKSALQLAEKLDLSGAWIAARPQARYRYLYINGRLQRLPTSPLSFCTTGVVSLAGKLRILRELWIRSRSDGSESVSAFFERRFGREVVERVVGPLVSGIYAGVPGELEMSSSFPRLVELERQAGSVLRGMLAKKKSTSGKGTMLSFRDGMEALPQAAARALGDGLRLHSRVRSVEWQGTRWVVEVTGESGNQQVEKLQAENLVVTAPATQAAKLLEKVDKELGQLLRGIPHAAVGVLQVGVRRELLPRALDGFGFLVPRSEDLAILGCIWASAIFPERAPEGCELLSVFLGGRSHPQLLQKPEEQIVELALGSLYTVMGGEFTPELLRLAVLPRAIPQYTLGHQQRLERLDQALTRHPQLTLAGSYLDGISVDSAIRSGVRAGASSSSSRSSSSRQL